MKTVSLLMLMGGISSAMAQSDLPLMEGAVAQLRGSLPITETFDGVEHEVWLRNTASPTNAPFPKRVQISGTGFLIVSSKARVYLATAKHIAEKMGPDCILTFRSANYQPIDARLTELSPSGNPFWVADQTADCAIHPIAFKSVDQATRLIKYAILCRATNLISEQIAPSKTLSLHMVGFPDAEGEGFGFSPSVRTANAETGLRTNSVGTFFFQLQLPGINGYSGAPVFESGNIPDDPAQIKVWGLLSATRDSGGVKTAIIIHALHLKRLIDAFEAAIVQTPVIGSGATNTTALPAPGR